MAVPRRYIVDSDVFIPAKNLYYAFEICPGFWASVIRHHRKGRVYSIDRVRSEVLAGRKTENLVQWVKNDLPAVVTNEQARSEAKSRVPLPNVCEQFGVTYTNTFVMLKEMAVRFVLAGAS